MNILIACDKFKGTLSSLEVGKALASNLKPDHHVEVYELSDGGEGFLNCISSRLNLEIFDWECQSQGILFKAQYGFDSDTQSIYIESSQLLGNPKFLDIPLIQRHSGPLGQLIKFSLKHHPKNIQIGLGGTLTADAGMGCLEAMGFSFYDSNQETLIPSSLNLQKINSIQMNLSYPQINALIDTLVPPSGKKGGIWIYGPQKGGLTHELEAIDLAVSSFSNFHGFSDLIGGGSAGGLGLGLKIALNANLIHGATHILDFLKLGEKLKSTDILITGEGEFNSSHLGKIVSKLLSFEVPTIIVTGKPIQDLFYHHFVSYYSLLEDKSMPVLSKSKSLDKLTQISSQILLELNHGSFINL